MCVPSGVSWKTFRIFFHTRVSVTRFADHEYRVDARLFDDGSWLNIAKEFFDEIVYQNPLFVNYGLWH